MGYGLEVIENLNTNLNQNLKNTFCVVKAVAFCAYDISFFLMSKLTDKSLCHHHSPDGTSTTQKEKPRFAKKPKSFWYSHRKNTFHIDP